LTKQDLNHWYNWIRSIKYIL